MQKCNLDELSIINDLVVQFFHTAVDCKYGSHISLFLRLADMLEYNQKVRVASLLLHFLQNKMTRRILNS